MKFLTSQVLAILSQGQARRNVKTLVRFAFLLVATISLFATSFRLIMRHVEGQEHSWVTGFYWTLTVMSTLGFGDITFHSDAGRAFSMVVLLTGIVLLLIVLPFVFIRYFYAPWLEARTRFQAPRGVPAATRGHVILCQQDSLAAAVMARLRLLGVRHFLLEPDPVRGAQQELEGIPVVVGAVEDRATWEALHVDQAQLVVANAGDTVNTNITLTVREVAPDVPIACVVEHEQSVDLLELSGSTYVMPLTQRLGEHLANRVSAGHLHGNVIGRMGELLIAEFPVHNTPLVGRTIREARLRDAFGLNVAAVWERGRMMPATPDTRLEDGSVPVVLGTSEQMGALDGYLVIYNTNYAPVLVVGGGKVGCAAARALRSRGVEVHLLEREEGLRPRLEGVADRLFIGDAADRALLMEAGLAEAPTVLLTTNDDAMNIYLAVYCRRLNPGLRIVSRITHDRNVEAIHRAGADFVLSYASLGAETVLALLQGRDSVILGEGFDLFYLAVPPNLEGKTVAQSELRRRTGLNLLALRLPGGRTVPIAADTVLVPGGELVLLGNEAQRQAFVAAFH
ncbi:MAG: NAD-binding protein [Deferrisomatales bacterium]|nr:NAD-binding protein [Deferrisomatales bacterium]